MALGSEISKRNVINSASGSLKWTSRNRRSRSFLELADVLVVIPYHCCCRLISPADTSGSLFHRLSVCLSIQHTFIVWLANAGCTHVLCNCLVKMFALKRAECCCVSVGIHVSVTNCRANVYIFLLFMFNVQITCYSQVLPVRRSRCG